MTPSVPTYRPVFTATRIATAVAVVSFVSSLALLMYSSADAAAVACTVSMGGLL